MKLRHPSRISLRLLAFNVLLVFLPVGGVLFLDTYESHLLRAQERTMAQEGRLLAAAIEARDRFEGEDAHRILVQLGQRHLARLRVVDQNGTVVADSALLGPRLETVDSAESTSDSPTGEASFLYRVGSLPFRLIRGTVGESRSDQEIEVSADASSDLVSRPEIRSALDGRYGAATRISPPPRRSVTLHIAIPVRVEGVVEGAVLVSQSTGRILQALDAVRLDVFKVFLLSLGAAVVLSLLAATTIARPITRLRERAGDILDRRGRLRGGFKTSNRRDEIGDLERALAELTRQLEQHLRSTEAFAADVSHEFKNPLASIRTATDMALEDVEPGQRRRFLGMIQKDIARMERLLSEAREISRIDANLDEEERTEVALDELLPALVESFRLRNGDSGIAFDLAKSDAGVTVEASADRLTQVFENLIDNAVSFSPPDGKVTVTVRRDGPNVEVTVSDEGPGIPDEHRDRIFKRFFSYRPDDEAGSGHTGLGLALVRAIVESHGGTIRAEGRSGGGTMMVVVLPLGKR
ncbi:MAG: histidine kinase [Acidobacteria bacterium]|jgi:two-component system sensor histidine kinase ChvG|nr:histidine kinase [Acidobacteriota bacterium]